ncbi:NADH:flavin oxidoreductase [Lutimaribacter sp. EGI FJ00015]|uniref:NADH:flavin oxidoreductase n=1 Tax=Lutimaribacter degradans TaxID=2945989 RepID=A0ACC5ZX37_9RHOB|nr:NADH:flavin oxidoreductase [Lutimaribacter sp. EGI FJ00013]MCM2562897.1 NADH:flavin oxidoreductase [Lutimaribacter sp. EGI FJ00013]MCO0614064.1 NADH:flavin oxidoreductase [Lutimaribacter sp. EGI FJ00015]MCO0636042.1 NADH:flavin oxidoreductase [Lutimaribacter sp. EGI FJ00014]
MSRDPLLQPYQLKHLTLKNRIMTTAHEPAYPEDGLPKDRYRAYHVERARGGVAMTMTAGSAIVSRDSPPAFNNVLAYRDEVVPWLRKLADECHDHGCAVMIQLTHLGWRTGWNKGDWLPALAPSGRREPAHRAFPKVMEEWDIARIISDYADAAERMQAAGLDGIELEAYGHLMDAFWSPRQNHLDGPYNGDLDARMKFSLDVLGAIRDRVGPDFIVGLRYTADDLAANGISTEDGIEIGKRLRDTGQVDFLNVIKGRLETDADLTDVIPVQGMAHAPHLDFAGHIRAEVGLPTFHAARIPDVATARHAVATGRLDMVGMTRAHMADPYIVAKIAAGREDDIRPCVGATYCLDRIYQGGELELPHVIPASDTPSRAVIIGAGPAGLEAARVAAERGHHVTVFEAADQPGGQVRLAAQDKRRAEMIGIIDWRMAQCAARDVEFRFNTWAEAADVTALSPDMVIVATGGIPDTDILSSGNDLVVSTWDILSGAVKPGQDVLIFDDAGDHPALMAAQAIAAHGAQVEIMTPDRSFAPEVMGMNLVPYMRALQDKAARFTVTYRLKSVARDGNRLAATIGTDYSDHTQVHHFDQVVVNHGTVPLDDLYFDLKPLSKNLGALDHDAFIARRPQAVDTNPRGRFRLFRIGDAVSARNTHAAIYDALRLMVAN